LAVEGVAWKERWIPPSPSSIWSTPCAPQAGARPTPNSPPRNAQLRRENAKLTEEVEGWVRGWRGAMAREAEARYAAHTRLPS
jgi:hypothetical protein